MFCGCRLRQTSGLPHLQERLGNFRQNMTNISAWRLYLQDGRERWCNVADSYALGIDSRTHVASVEDQRHMAVIVIRTTVARSRCSGKIVGLHDDDDVRATLR